MPPLRKEREAEDTEQLLDLSEGRPQEPHTTVRLRRLYSLSPQVLWATCTGTHTHSPVVLRAQRKSARRVRATPATEPLMVLFNWLGKLIPVISLIYYFCMNILFYT